MLLWPARGVNLELNQSSFSSPTVNHAIPAAGSGSSVGGHAAARSVAG
jgi:hypothetical protein